MEVVQHNEEKNGYFSAIEGDKIAGKVIYTWAGKDKFIINGTEVDAAFSGQGVGKKLVLAAVNYARENQVKIMPLCPFAKSVFDKDADLKDVLF